MMKKIFLPLLLMTIVGACSAEKTSDALPDFEQLVLNSYIAPFKNAETEKWLQVFAEDAVGMHNTLPAFVGKEAIAQFGAMVGQNLNIEQMDVVIDDVRVNGSWALTRGSFVSKFVPKNMEDSSAIKPAKGKFILLWEQQENGEWKVILDMGNSSESPLPPS
ncbi:MAG: nuclear transport factor 2 family protein [Gammaproteobacteria bacterium]|jgi:ketosteroid isomerase-like protein|nr:nuclear transport factor 2 family protein [Gammaproteobacteria bacterium]